MPTLGFKGFFIKCCPAEIRNEKINRTIKVSKERTNRLCTKLRSEMRNTNQEITQEEKQKRIELENFFDYVAKEIAKNPHCWECGAFIPKAYYRSSSAHVIQKRKEYGFPSVAANKDNFLILGAHCKCHGRYDTCWEYAAQMKVFPIAIEKFKKIYPFIDKSEYKNIPEVLLQEIEPK
jgi:hypothetical protein